MINILNIGMGDCAGIMAKWKGIFDKHSKKYKIRNLVFERSALKYDIDLLPNSPELKEVIKNTDIFIFHPFLMRGEFTEELIEDGANSKICNINWPEYTIGKKVYAFLNGSTNLRHFAKEYNELLPKQYDKVFCSTPDLTLLFKFAKFIPVPLEIDTKFPERTENKVTICHLPTDPHIKNTKEFEEVCKELKEEFPLFFDYKTITLVPNKEVINIKKKFHLCFDHMQGYYGVNSLEAAAVGCIPLVGINRENLMLFRKFANSNTHPFEIVRNKEELKNCIKYYINHPKEMKKQAKRCYNWMKTYWDPKIHIKKFIDYIEEEKKETISKRQFIEIKKVSVVIPTYNREIDVQKAIKSVLNQTYKDVEILVVDDGSTDKTQQIIKKIMEKYKNVKYIYKENGGCASALNEGIRNSNGELIAWLSSDDWYDFEDNKLLEKAVKAHTENPNVGMTYVDYTVVEPNREWEFKAYENDSRNACIVNLFKNCYINGSSIVVKKEVFYTVGFFNESFRYAQDYEFYFRVLTRFDIKKLHYDKKPMLNYSYDSKKECLGKKITEGKHSNESQPVIERYNLIFEKNRPIVCAMLCAKNEEELINNCLNDLSMYVDHIVLMDDGSTDNTLNLAKKWRKVKYIITQQPKGNVRTEGEDRQKLLDLAYYTKADYFLFVDVDEQFEDRYKTEIFKEMKEPSVNLWFYQQINFWRSKEYFRIDELYYDIAWFGRLFKVFPNLKIGKGNEHCGGIPNNLPNTSMWFHNEPTQRKSRMRVKHYGFATEKKIIDKYINLMERDDISIEERHNRYDRLLKENTLKLKKYYEQPYYLIKQSNIKEEILSCEQFGKSKRMAEVLKKYKNEK